VTARIPGAPPRIGSRPIVAIVGRPNVGKSALFNRLAGARLAIVEDQPGVTRDRHYADADLFGVPAIVVDTGGFDPEPGDPVTDLTRSQVLVAVAEADVLVCVFDGRTELTAADHETVRLLRRSAKPVVFAANKVDGDRQESGAFQAYELGIDDLVLISALHGRGVGDLVDRVVAALPERAEAPTEDDEQRRDDVRVAIVGRPNVGKSSLTNRILGEERMLTDDRPGTTRDAIDSLFEHDGRRLVLIDTAGVRRRSRVADAPERHAVFAAIRSLERAHVAVLLIDAASGAAEQDARIAGLAIDRGCGLVLAPNKLDLIEGGEARRSVERQCRDVFTFVRYAPLVGVSAKTGRGVRRLLETVVALADEYNRRVGTGELNQFLEELVARKPPPLRGTRPVKLYYAAQVAVRPPKFVITCNYPDAIHFSYHRFVTNRIRERFGFEHAPLRVVFKARGRRGK